MDPCIKQKLLAFGFTAQAENYIYTRDIADGQMTVTVTFAHDGTLRTKVADSASGEEYVLHRVPNAEGAFVGKVRTEHDALVDEIYATCFGTAVFKNDQLRAVVSYVRDTYGDEPEFLWKSAPQNAIIRRGDNKKWYIAILTVSRQKLGMDSSDSVEIIDLRISPDEVAATVDRKRYFPGFHMNKKHWITLCLDGTIPFGEICERIDNSYKLAKK